MINQYQNLVLLVLLPRSTTCSIILIAKSLLICATINENAVTWTKLIGRPVENMKLLIFWTDTYIYEYLIVMKSLQVHDTAFIDVLASISNYFWVWYNTDSLYGIFVQIISRDMQIDTVSHFWNAWYKIHFQTIWFSAPGAIYFKALNIPICRGF